MGKTGRSRRDRMRAGCQPELAPGEVVEQVFPAHRFGGPWLVLAGLFGVAAFLPVPFLSGPVAWLCRLGAAGLLVAYYVGLGERIVCVTNRRVVVFSVDWRRSDRPKAMVASLVRTVPFDTTWYASFRAPVGRTTATGEVLYIEEQFRVDVRAADASAHRAAGRNGNGSGRVNGREAATIAAAGRPDAEGAGWFPDPDGGVYERWFDGRRWTYRVRHVSPDATHP